MNSFKYRSLIGMVILTLLFSSCKKERTTAINTPFQFPSKEIHKIRIDDTGVKWVATAKGVVSFDNSNWTTYADKENLTTGLISDVLLEVTSGLKKLWMGTNVGLSAFGFGPTAITVTTLTSKTSDLLSDTITAMGMDIANVKYIGTSKGLSIYNGSSWVNFTGQASEPILSKYRITAISIAGNGYVYAATKGGGVSRFQYTDAVSGAITLKDRKSVV